MRIILPSLFGVNPRSLMEIDFSIKANVLRSKGCMEIVCESGVEIVANDLSGDGNNGTIDGASWVKEWNI